MLIYLAESEDETIRKIYKMDWLPLDSRFRPPGSPMALLIDFTKPEAEVRDEDGVTADSLPTTLGEKRHDYPSARKVPYENINGMTAGIFRRPGPTLTREHDQSRSTDESGKI